MIWRPSIVYSGGNTGADVSGLRAARRLNIPTGGWAAWNWMTERGPAPGLAGYGLRIHPNATERDPYSARTDANVHSADLTVLFHRPPLDGGSWRTFRTAGRADRPCHVLTRADLWLNGRDGHGDPIREPHPETIYRFRCILDELRPEVLNVAGNRESKSPGIQGDVYWFLLAVWGEG